VAYDGMELEAYSAKRRYYRHWVG